MASNPWVSGAVPIYLGFYNSGFQSIVSGGTTVATPTAIEFLGYTVNGLDIQWEHNYEPFKVDVGGSAETDSSYQGKTAIITMTLSWWDDDVYFDLTPDVGADFGQDDPGNIGTLMVNEGQCVGLILPFPYQAKAAYSNQVAGLYFYATRLQQDNWKDLGTRPRNLSLSFRAMRVFLPAISNTYGYGAMALVTDALPALPPPT